MAEYSILRPRPRLLPCKGLCHRTLVELGDPVKQDIRLVLVEYRLRASQRDVGEGRLVQHVRIERPGVGQMLDDYVDELDLRR